MPRDGILDFFKKNNLKVENFRVIGPNVIKFTLLTEYNQDKVSAMIDELRSIYGENSNVSIELLSKLDTSHGRSMIVRYSEVTVTTENEIK